MQTAPATLIVALFGLVIGSFLNVVIHRLPDRRSLAVPGSHCPVCDSPIRPLDNIPVLSWMILRGRCRHCQVPISVRYPLVEALTGGLFALAGWRIGPHPQLANYCIFIAVLIALSGIDLDHHILPSRIIYPASAMSLALLAVSSGIDGQWRRLGDGVLGGILGFAALFAIHVAAPRGMGFGDVRLAGYIGLNVAWLGLAQVAVALFAGFLFGAVVGVALIGAGAATRRSRIPFGPFLAAGAVTAVLWGTQVVHWWLGPR